MVAQLPLTGDLGSNLTELYSAFKAFQKLKLLDLRGDIANSEYCDNKSNGKSLHKPMSLCVPVADNGLGVRAATHLARVLPDNCRLRVIKCK